MMMDIDVPSFVKPDIMSTNDVDGWMYLSMPCSMDIDDYVNLHRRDQITMLGLCLPLLLQR